MDMKKYSIQASVLGIKLICDEMVIKRDVSVAQIQTAANGVIFKKQGIKSRIILLKGKAICNDYIALQSCLENGLKSKTTVIINYVQYQNAEIYSYSIKLKEGEKLAEVSVELYMSDE